MSARLNRFLRSSCVLGFAACQLSGIALAQPANSSGTPDPQSADAPVAKPTISSQSLRDEIVVTGSRIVRSGASTPTPTVMLGNQDIASAGSVSPGDLLRQLPAVGPGVGSESSGVTFNGAGLDLLDLRTLGTNRTLTLINGRRQVGSNPSDTSVDVNTIPTPMIDRVEVITGGASAVYGADAVSGVVNFVLKRNFEGIQLDGQTGISSRGDAPRYEASLLAGSNFAEGRGNVMLYGGYTHEGGIAYNQRPGGISGSNWIANPASKSSSDGIPDYIIVSNVRQIGGQQTSAFILNNHAYGFNADGSVRNFGVGPSGLIGGGQFTDGGEAELGYDAECPQAKCPLRIPVDRYLLSGNAHYELTDYAELFFEGRFADTKASSRFGSVFEIPPVTNQISIDNPYVSSSLRTLLQSAGATSVGILRSDQELGLRGQDTDRRIYEFVGGSRGNLGLGNFKYEAAIQYGSTRFTNTRVNDIDQAKFENAIDAFRDIDGVIKCRSVTAQAQGCVPINLLLPGAAISKAALSYVEIPYATETASLSQFVAGGNVTGTLGNFWGAGDISVAGGVEYRRERSVYLVSPVDQAGQGFYYTKRQSTSGGFHVFEFYGEAVVPLLKDLPFIKSLEIEGAARRSNYSTSGTTTSWKAGASYAPVSDIRFRAVLARAVRAPNVGELYSPGSEGFITVDDPCDVNFVGSGGGNRATNCRALGVPANYISNARTINIRTSTSGNAGLGVERANTLTAGAVLTPRFLPGLSATVDYFRISIKDAINVFSSQDILNNCVDLASVDNAFCQSITRSASGDIQQIRSQYINVSRLEREGVDMEVRYRQRLGGLGVLNFDAVATRMMKVTTVVAPGTLTGSNEINYNGQFGYPKWKARFSTIWQLEPFEVTGTLNYLSNMVRDVQPTDPEDNRATTGTGNFFIFNMQAAVNVTKGLRYFVGVDNVFDRLPPNLPDTRLGGASSYPGAEIFSNLGRYFYTGLRAKF